MGSLVRYGVPVAPLLWERGLNSLLLTGCATLFAWLMAIPIGVFWALASRGWASALWGFLTAGLLATLVSCALALFLGGLSGYHGGVPDRILMQVSDLFLALPWLYLLFAVRALLPLDLSPASAFAMVVLLLSKWSRWAAHAYGPVSESGISVRGTTLNRAGSDSFLLNHWDARGPPIGLPRGARREQSQGG